MKDDAFLSALPRCGEIFPPGQAMSDTTSIRRRDASGFVGSHTLYHAACAPLVGGRLPRAGFEHVLPQKAIENVRTTYGGRVEGWRMTRRIGEQELRFEEGFDAMLRHEARLRGKGSPARLFMAERLRRARRIMRRALAEHQP